MLLIFRGNGNVPVILEVSLVDTSTGLPSSGIITLIDASNNSQINAAAQSPSYQKYVLHDSAGQHKYHLHIISHLQGAGPAVAYIQASQNGMSMQTLDGTGAVVVQPAISAGLPTGVDAQIDISEDLA